MADTKLTALPAAAAVAGADLLYSAQGGASVKTTATQVKTFTSASPTLVTPTLGVATGTSLALGGATIGSDVLAVTGTSTFNGSPLTQNTTTTSPGFYAQITGDSVPRVRVGVNANDVASIGFGSGAATRDLFLERAGAASLRMGNIDVAAPIAQSLSVQNVITGTTDTAGVNFTIKGSQGTGTGAGGSIVFQVAPAGSTSNTPNALATSLTLNSSLGAIHNGLVTVTQGTANTGILATTGYSLTGSSTTNMLDLAGTWNTSGAPNGIKLSITNTTSSASSNLLLLQGGAAGATTEFKVSGTGDLTFAGNITGANATLFTFGSRSSIQSSADGNFIFSNNATTNSFRMSFPTASATPTLQLGIADAAAPIAQTIKTQSVVAGTSNTAGVSTTFKASAGTGTGVGGSLIFQTAAAGSTGTAQNAVATMFTINTTGIVIASGGTLTLGNAATTGLTAGVLSALTNASVTITDSTGQVYRIPCII